MSDSMIQEMIDFFDLRVSGMFSSAQRMQAEPLLQDLGIFLQGVGESYYQVLRWAQNVLSQPVPSPEDQAGLAQWMTCYRVFRRQLRTFGNHPDFSHAWFEDDPESVREVVHSGHLSQPNLNGSAS